MTHKVPQRISIVIIFILVGCEQASHRAPDTAVPSINSVSAVPETPTPNLNEATELPTPGFPVEEVSRSLLLSTGHSASCQLPCWHGLQVGESNKEDMREVFEQLFNAAPGYDFFAPPEDPDYLLAKLISVEGATAGGHNWYFEDPETGVAGVYYLYAYLSQDGDSLLAIKEVMRSFGVYEVPSLPDAVTRLGKPDWIYAATGPALFTAVLFYKRGIRVSVDLDIEESDSSTSRICFDAEPVQESYTIAGPYTFPASGDRSVSGAPTDPAPYISEELGMSIEEFMEFVISSSPCIETPG